MICKYCGNPMNYTGLDDGGGDYGDEVCDQWECEDCDYQDEDGCFGGEPIDDPGIGFIVYMDQMIEGDHYKDEASDIPF